MGIYTSFLVFFFYNKCSENSRSEIVFRTDIFPKLTLDAPDDRCSGNCNSASTGFEPWLLFLISPINGVLIQTVAGLISGVVFLDLLRTPLI